MKNNLPVFGIVTALLIVFRCLTEKSPYLTETIAIINLVALLIVIFSITIQIKKELTGKIKQLGVPQEITLREIGDVRKRIDIFTYVPLGVFSVIYVALFASTLVNDIISIIALCLSLSDAYIVKTVVNSYKL